MNIAHAIIGANVGLILVNICGMALRLKPPPWWVLLIIWLALFAVMTVIAFLTFKP
jgi:hypothetical protein